MGLLSVVLDAIRMDVIGNFAGFIERDIGPWSYWPGGFRSRVFHATKTEMIGAGVDFAFAARADDVARSVC